MPANLYFYDFIVSKIVNYLKYLKSIIRVKICWNVLIDTHIIPETILHGIKQFIIIVC